MISFIIGLIIGFIAGAFIISALVLADDEEKIYEKQDK